MSPYADQRGMTALELLFSIGILMIISLFILSALTGYQARKGVSAAVERVIAIFSVARLDAVSSLNADQYGIHLQSDRLVYFKGSTYSAVDPNNVTYMLERNIMIEDILLSGGGSDVVFNRLKGSTNQSGTFAVRSISRPAASSTIVVSATGAVALK